VKTHFLHSNNSLWFVSRYWFMTHMTIQIWIQSRKWSP